jgi:signal transduction histidine kinase
LIAVEDEGPGVDPAEAERIFEPFVTNRADGTGLGLAIARELAEAQGGTLRLEPSPRGGRFVLSLPWSDS